MTRLVGVVTLVLVAAVAEAQDRYIVGVSDLVADSAALRARGLQIERGIGISRALVVTGDVATLQGLPFVRYIEPDPLDAVHTQQDDLPIGADRIDAEMVWGGSQGATDVIPGEGGGGVKVAIIDSGIACSHPDLAPDCFDGANFVTPGVPSVDDHGHGTHVAGIVAARDNDIGLVGVAPKVELYAVKVLGSGGGGSWSAVAAGIDWAVANHMHVINMSLGGFGGSQVVADALIAAKAAGVLVISAAGNNGCCNTVLYPAKYPESMAIAAVDDIDQRASFSATGPEIDVAAPGVMVLSTVPTGTCTLCDPSGYMRLSGTSMATPHVTGVAALLLQKGWTAEAVWTQLTATALDLGIPGWDEFYGFGRVDALKASGDNPPNPPPPPPDPEPPDTVPPTVRIVSPAPGTVIERLALLSIAIEATDNTQVAFVDVFVNGGLKCRLTNDTVCEWRTPGAPRKDYSLLAVAVDTAGNVGVSEPIVVVSEDHRGGK